MTLPHWFLLGAGNIGSLAAWYLQQAGHQVTALRETPLQPQDKTLHWRHRTETLAMPQQRPADCRATIRHLLITTKTPHTVQRLRQIRALLAEDVRVVQLQNGLLDIRAELPNNAHLITALTTSAVKGQHPAHHIVAENATWWGGSATPPDWFAALQLTWPNLSWDDEIRQKQWYKLVVNAVINPLTAIHDVANGQIADDPAIKQQAEALCREANRILKTVDPAWAGVPFSDVLGVALATRDNTSSMRADHRQRHDTEVNAINGVLLAHAHAHGLDAPMQQWVLDQLSR